GPRAGAARGTDALPRRRRPDHAARLRAPPSARAAPPGAPRASRGGVLGGGAPGRRPGAGGRQAGRRRGRARLARHGAPPACRALRGGRVAASLAAGPLVGVAAGSGWATKRWAPEGFAAVIGALAAEGARCVVLGAAEDAALAAEINHRAGGCATVLAGRTDLPTMVAVVDRLALLIANDSAPMHIACARGVPVVAVFCATTPALGYGPWGRRATVVEA